MRSRKEIHQKKSRSKLYKNLLSIVVLLATFLGIATGYYSSKVLNFLDNISESNPKKDPEVIQNTEQLKNLEPFSVIILGTDVEEHGAARSDTIIVATINPDSKDMKMVSIPRDTLITLPNGEMEKINAAFATAGPLLTREMVGDYLDIHIDFYASMDFDGLVQLVDAVDGVTVNSDLEFTEGIEHIEKGVQKLDGKAALAYARMRKMDPRGDFGRQDRQKEVIISILKKLNSSKSITNMSAILDSIAPYLKTNATSEQMIGMGLNYSPALNNIEQLTIDGEGDSVYFPSYDLDLYVWEAYEESLAEVQNKLNRHLKKTTKTVEVESEPTP